MKVTIYTRLFLPSGAAGAEWYMVELAHYLRLRGHEVDVASMTTRERYDFEGIPVHPVSVTAYRPDVMVSHLEGYPLAREASRVAGVPLVHVAHHPFQAGHPCDLLVCNSRGVSDSVRHANRLVVYPPVNPERYRVESEPAVPDRSAIVLLNLMREKGAHTFYDLARRMPDRQFLGVKGAWGNQVVTGAPMNLTIMGNLPSPRGPLEAARVVLMPSHAETFGRVAVEAACAGRVSIVSPLAGLREAMGDAGLYADPHDPAEWERIIRCLDDADLYACHRDEQHARALDLWALTLEQLDRLEDAICSL